MTMRAIAVYWISFVESNTLFKVCGEAENGAEAIKKANERQPDLVLLDLTMPVLPHALWRDRGSALSPRDAVAHRFAL